MCGLKKPPNLISRIKIMAGGRWKMHQLSFLMDRAQTKLLGSPASANPSHDSSPSNNKSLTHSPTPFFHLEDPVVVLVLYYVLLRFFNREDGSVPQPRRFVICSHPPPPWYIRSNWFYTPCEGSHRTTALTHCEKRKIWAAQWEVTHIYSALWSMCLLPLLFLWHCLQEVVLTNLLRGPHVWMEMSLRPSGQYWDPRKKQKPIGFITLSLPLLLLRG